jgi:vacuolar-type H+-ATPase subunit H
MSLEKIVEKIVAEARDEAERIVLESRKKAEEIKQAAKKEADEKAAARMSEADREAQLQAGRIVTQARLEKKLLVLQQKRDLVDQVLTRAFDSDSLHALELKRTVVVRDGEREEVFDRRRLIAELQTRLESEILELLEI